MKNRVISSIIFLVYGALLAVGPHTIFSVCEQGEKIMRCGWTGKVETGIGIFVIYLAIIQYVCKEKKSQVLVGL